MKSKHKILFFSILVLPIVSILNINSQIPSELILTEDCEYSINLKYPCKIADTKNVKSVSASDSSFFDADGENITLNTNSCGNYDLPVKIFNKIPVKNISVTVTPKKYVIPSGDTIGIKMYTKGLLVVGVSDFVDDTGKNVAPAKDADIREGDRIVKVNGVEITTSEQFGELIRQAGKSVVLSVEREAEVLKKEVVPAYSGEDGSIKLGIWVRDSTAGIGTLTFFEPTDSEFAALGHAICDTDTGEVMTVREGSLITCNVLSVVKGKSGEPGELVGGFSNKTIGKVYKNNEMGIYGDMEKCEEIEFTTAMETATRFQIKEGAAKILADVDNNGVKEYDVEIVKISKSAKVDNKGIVIKVTDGDLIEKTGGIVQGMSGSPIIQNDMLVGAVTHVFVNDPTRGYGVFVENMLKEAERIK